MIDQIMKINILEINKMLQKYYLDNIFSGKMNEH